MRGETHQCCNCGQSTEADPDYLCEECIEECDHITQGLHAEIKAWRYRFPDLEFKNKLDGIQPKG